MDLSQAIDEGLLDPAASAKRVPFPRLGYDALVHPMSLRTMERDQIATGNLVGTVFKLAEIANFGADEKTPLTDAQFWAVVLGMLPQASASLLRVVSSCTTWELRADAADSAVEPVTADLPHFVLPLLTQAWVEVNFPDPLAMAGWVQTATTLALHLAPQETEKSLLSTLSSILRRSSASSSGDGESKPSEPGATGSEP